MITKEVENFLRERTADIRHSGRTLYDHLVGTHNILEKAGSLPHVRLAGLFHSIYGTNIFAFQTLKPDQREEVSEVIGDRAERLAYIFCACNRPKVFIDEALHGPPYSVRNRFNGETIALTPQDLSDLLAVELANLMEQDSWQSTGQVAMALGRVTSSL